jgi:hypothetical protein
MSLEPRYDSAMAQTSTDAQIDRLYQLPLEEFTTARNALAKDVAATSKKDADEIRRLPKPPLPAWGVNQLYWQARPVYHGLMAASSALRDAHAALASGKRADLRAAGKAHEDALDTALKTTLTILQQSGHQVTDATKQAVGTTLHGLPGSGDPPGRLARTLQPSGFELLAGLPTPTAGGSSKPAAPPPRAAAPVAPPPRTKDATRAKAIAKAKEAVAAATRAERTAEQNAKRDEFEAARITRDADRANAKLTAAKKAFEDAQDALATAEEDASGLMRKKDVATRRARESADTLAAARVRTGTAHAELARVEKS